MSNPGIGHNNPPDAMAEIQSRHDDLFSEIANWADGVPVENEGQMQAVDGLIAMIKSVDAEAKAAKEAEYRPHKTACDMVVARWKPFIDDLERQKVALLAVVDPFKRKLAAERDAERRRMEAEAREAMRKAEMAALEARSGDLEAMRTADALAETARAAVESAHDAPRVKGLRTFTIRTIDDGVACARWVWANDRDAMMTFLDDYVRRCDALPDGVTERKEKRAV